MVRMHLFLRKMMVEKLPIGIGGFEAQSVIALEKTSNHHGLLLMIYLKNLQKILKLGLNR